MTAPDNKYQGDHQHRAGVGGVGAVHALVADPPSGIDFAAADLGLADLSRDGV